MKTKKLNLEDVCNFVGGSQPPKEVFSDSFREEYIRLIQIRDYKTDGFITYIPKKLARRFCNKSDIMIGRYGPPIFQICRGLDGAYNVALMKAVPKQNVLNEYLYYFLKQDSLFKYIDSLSLRTGGQTGVDIECLKKYPIQLPNLDCQQKIADVLSALDAKIELNNRINAELESLAKTIYDYWFVQFDFPFDFTQGKPNADGKPYKSSGGEMVYVEEGKGDRAIPAGWEIGTLYDLANIAGGSTPSTANPLNFCKNGTAWITPKDLSLNMGNKFISKGELDVTEAGMKDASLKIFPKATILLSSRAPIGYMAISRNDVTTNQGFKSFIPNKGFSTPFVYYAIKNSMQSIVQYASGSTFKEISLTSIKSIKVCLPDHIVVNLYTEKVKPIFRQQDILEQENQQLTQLRDWLLPMLMNGQVSIK